MALPASGWIATPQQAPPVPFPLPEPWTGSYRQGGAVRGRTHPQAAAVVAAGRVEARAEAGRAAAERTRSLSVTLTQRDVFGVLLVDSVDFTYTLPPPMLDTNFRVSARVEVEDASGAWVDLSALAGRDWVEEMEWDEDIDQPVSQATVTLWRESRPEQSLAPMLERSGLNLINQALPQTPANFAPLLQPGRQLRIWTATTYADVPPAAADWKGAFWGTLDEVDWGGGNRVRLTARDLGGDLMDTFIEEEKPYGPPPATGGGEEAETGLPPAEVMQALLDDHLPGQKNPDGTPKPGRLLVHHEPDAEGLPREPEWAVRRYMQERKPLLEALRDVALQFGWDVRFRWNAPRTEYRLTLFEPERAKTAADYTLGPSEYLDVSRLSVSRADVRNVVKVAARTDAGAEVVVTKANEHSIADFGRRFMEIREASTSLINTAALAEALADAVLADLSVPVADQEVELLYFWPARVGDLYCFRANQVHYDHDQLLAAVRVRHALSRDKQRTTLAVRGKPAGAFRDWLRRERRRPGQDTAPIVDVRTLETQAPDPENPAGSLEVGVLWWKIQERETPVTAVLAQAQFGDNAPGAFGAPLRDAGDASVVRGGTLARGEYEHQVALHHSRFSWITVRLTLATGEVMTLGPYGFDRNKTPSILSHEVTGASPSFLLRATGDTDTQSWRAWRVLPAGSTATAWEERGTGTSFSVAIPVPTGEQWQVMFGAYASPEEQNHEAGTPREEKQLLLGEVAAGSPTVGHLFVYAPEPGMDLLQIDTACSLTSAAHSRRFEYRENRGSYWTGWYDVTAELTTTDTGAPPPEACSADPGLYQYATGWYWGTDNGTSGGTAIAPQTYEDGYTRTEYYGTSTRQLVRVEVRASILDASGGVVHQLTRGTSWWWGGVQPY